MKVGILINSFNLGGAEKLVYDVARILKKREISFTLISMKRAETKIELQIENKLINMGYEVASINKPAKKRRCASILAIMKLVRNRKIDILHTNGQSPDFYGRLAKLLLPNLKIIVTIHSTSGYSIGIEKYLSALTTKYTAVSKQAARYAQNDLRIKKDICVIDNGIDFSQYIKTKENTKNRFIILS